MSDRPRRRAPSSAPQRSPRPRRRSQILFAAGILALALGAFYTALVVATQIDQIFFPDSEINLGGLGKLPGIDSGNDDADIGKRRINVLFMGMDRRSREGNAPTRTDTMFVVTVDPATHTARGLAMPRDLWVDIPTKSGNSTFKERINAAYVIGELQGYSGGGPGLAKQTVEKLLGIKIDYYVNIDLEGFKTVIKALGGIDVDVPENLAVNDRTYSDTELPGDYYPCVVKPGLQHLDEKQALCFARVRNGSSDLDRILRQQLIIYAVMDRVTSLRILADPQNAVNLWKQYKNAISTDVTDLQILGFAKLAASIDPNQVSFGSLAAAVTPWTTPDLASVLQPSKEGIKQLVEAFLADDRLLQENASVEVQNGTGLAGQATKAIDFLSSLGIPNGLLVAVNAAEEQSQTQIIDYSGKTYTARRLAAWLNLPEERIRRATPADQALRSSQSDIVIILGADAKLESAVAP